MGPKQEFFIRSANDYLYYFCTGMAQNNCFTSANPNILSWYLLLFPLWSQLPQCQPNIFDPMRSSTLQEGRQSWSNKVKGVGQGENNIQEDGKFTSAWVSINFFRHIKVRHGPQIICRCRRHNKTLVNFLLNPIYNRALKLDFIELNNFV
jgi:hypothetical protein